MLTKRDLEERVAELEEALKKIHELLDDALEIEDEENPEGEEPE